MIVLFCLFMIVVRLAANLLSAAFQLPLLNGVNALLGGVFGLLLTQRSTVWICLAAVPGVYSHAVRGHSGPD